MARTKYSFKYNGKIVRNSNRMYKYALVNQYNAVIACSGTEQGALKQRTSWLNFLTKQLEYCKKHKPDMVESYEIDINNTKKWHTVELEVIEN